MAFYVEKSDSSAAQMRALAAALHGRHFDMYGLGFAARSAMRWLSWVPRGPAAAAARLALGRIGLPQSAADAVREDEMALWAASLYPLRNYRTIILGAPSGGASHIGSILDAPFLSSHFLLCFSDVRNVDDVYTTAARARRLAGRIARNNPSLSLVAHFDPVHDRPVLVFINHIRAKLARIPRPYSRFIARNLADDGALVLIRCEYKWKQYRLKPRVTFQIGGLGGIPDAEYLEGSSRLAEYRTRHGDPAPGDGGWRLRDGRYELCDMPESEWGGEPDFEASARHFASANGIKLLVLTADHPEKFSELALELHIEASCRDSVEPSFVFADCFNQLDPVANLKSRLLPLWLPYYCDRSFNFARSMLDRVPEDARVLFTMHPSLADPFDMIPLDDWTRLFTRREPPMLVGVDPDRFPHDFTYILDFARKTRAFCASHPDPVRARLDARDLAAAALRIGISADWH